MQIKWVSLFSSLFSISPILFFRKLKYFSSFLLSVTRGMKHCMQRNGFNRFSNIPIPRRKNFDIILISKKSKEAINRRRTIGLSAVESRGAIAAIPSNLKRRSLDPKMLLSTGGQSSTQSLVVQTTAQPVASLALPTTVPPTTIPATPIFSKPSTLDRRRTVAAFSADVMAVDKKTNSISAIY